MGVASYVTYDARNEQTRALRSGSGLPDDDTIDIEDVGIVVNRETVRTRIHGHPDDTRVEALAGTGITFRTFGKAGTRFDPNPGRLPDPSEVVLPALVNSPRSKTTGTPIRL